MLVVANENFVENLFADFNYLFLKYCLITSLIYVNYEFRSVGKTCLIIGYHGNAAQIPRYRN